MKLVLAEKPSVAQRLIRNNPSNSTQLHQCVIGLNSKVWPNRQHFADYWSVESFCCHR